jgi:hypothetical protein
MASGDGRSLTAEPAFDSDRNSDGHVSQTHRLAPASPKHELARTRGLPAAVGWDRGQVECPGDRLDAHRSPPGHSLTRPAGPRALAKFVSHSFTPVRGRSPAAAGILSALVTKTGGRW